MNEILVILDTDRAQHSFLVSMYIVHTYQHRLYLHCASNPVIKVCAFINQTVSYEHYWLDDQFDLQL